MRTHEERPEPDWPQVGENMLNRVCIDGDYAGRGCPLMVDLVDVLVELGVMKEPAQQIKKTNVITEETVS